MTAALGASFALPAGMPRCFGTIMADPPWAYQATTKHHSLRGYSTNNEYPALDTEALCELPVADYTEGRSVLLLWTTWPFIADALRVMDAWGFAYVTGLPWVKVTGLRKSAIETSPLPADLKPIYGVGYWMRGCTELILLGKQPNTVAVRTNDIGLISENFKHSRKPHSIYELAEKFPGPYLELFARERRSGWHVLGNEAPGDLRDIRESLVPIEGVERERRRHSSDAAVGQDARHASLRRLAQGPPPSRDESD